MLTLNFFQQKTTKPSVFPDLTFCAAPAHTESAKFNRDSHSHNWRYTRQYAAGFFSPVEYVTVGFMPGLRGLKNGESRNKRVAYQLCNEKARQFLHSLKNLTGRNTMTALNVTGAPVRNLLAYLPPLPLPGKKYKKTESLTITSTATGLIVWRDQTPVAWIYPGHHTGQIANQPKTCRFVDVAYHRQTERGVNLETADFPDLQSAFDFVRSLFEGGAA